MPKGAKREFTSVRITGLFQSKKRGLYVGTARPEEVASLRKKLKEAVDQEKGVVFFLFKNTSDEENQPKFNLSADVAQDKPKGKAKSKPIQDDDDEETEAEDDLDL